MRLCIASLTNQNSFNLLLIIIVFPEQYCYMKFNNLRQHVRVTDHSSHLNFLITFYCEINNNLKIQPFVFWFETSV